MIRGEKQLERKGRQAKHLTPSIAFRHLEKDVVNQCLEFGQEHETQNKPAIIQTGNGDRMQVTAKTENRKWGLGVSLKKFPAGNILITKHHDTGHFIFLLQKLPVAGNFYFLFFYFLTTPNLSQAFVKNEEVSFNQTGIHSGEI